MNEAVDQALRSELDELVAGLCKGLNDSKRLLLLYALSDGPHTVSELSDVVGTPQSNTSQHLAVLRTAGMVDSERRGNSVVYSLRHPKVIDAINTLREILADEVGRRRRAISA